MENKEQLETSNTRSSSPSQSPRTERQSSYGAMVLEAHEVPVFNCMIAAVSNWLFLAGFVVLPGTFTSLSHAALLSKSQAGREVQDFIRNMSLLAVVILCCSVGGAGIGWVSWKLRGNYVWLVDRIFLPGLLNAVVAFLMSLINIYTAQDGNWSKTAIATVCIIGVWGAITGSMLAVCELLLRKLRRD